MCYIYSPQYSTTRGEMWVQLGDYNSVAKARKQLVGFARAGNPVRILKWKELPPGDMAGVDTMLADGRMSLVEWPNDDC